MTRTSYDVAIVGAGPNGLTAAAVLGRAGLSVVVLERNAVIGGSCRTEPLTLPGFAHDVCGAIHPIGAVSPIFQKLELVRYGLDWATAPIPLAHPFDDGRVAVLSRQLPETAATLGADGAAWVKLMRPFVDRHQDFFSSVLRPVRVPRHPVLMARFGAVGLLSARRLASRFEGSAARALFAGNAAHSCLALDAFASASFGLVLAVAAHTVDWPCARGGSQQIVTALAAEAESSGCEIRTGVTIRSVREIPDARAVMLDLTPRQIHAIAADALSPSYRRRLQAFRYGAGAFRSTMRCRTGSPGERRSAARRRPCTPAGPTKKSREAKQTRTRIARRRRHSCWWRSRATSTRPAPRRVATPAGPIVMYPTDPRWT